MSDESRPKHPGGRPKGAKSHDNDGIFKKCPCPRRKWAKCAHAWFFTFRYKRLYRFSLNKLFNKPPGYHMSRTEAEGLRDDLRSQIRNGTFRAANVAEANEHTDTRLTFSDVAERYVTEFAKDPNRRPHRARRLAKQFEAIGRTDVRATRGTTMRFGDKVFADMATPDIEDFRDGRRDYMTRKQRERDDRMARLAKGDTSAKAEVVSTERPRSRNGEVGINRHLELIRHLFNWGIRKGYYDRENPFLLRGQRVIDFAKEKARTRRLQPGEEEKLLANAVPHLQAIIIGAIETGCRRRELLTLQWRNVRYDAKGTPIHVVVTAENSKTDAERKIPVSPRLRAVLEMRRTGPDGEPHGPDAYVFGNEVGEQFDSIKTSWRSACRKAGIVGLTFHDLRREHGSRLIEGGVNLLAVSKLLGHQKVTTTNTYLNASEIQVEEQLRAYHARQAATAKRPPTPKAARKPDTARPN